VFTVFLLCCPTVRVQNELGKVAGEVILSIDTAKPLGNRGSAPDPTGRAYSAPPDPVAGGEGLAAHPQEPYPASALRASGCGPWTLPTPSQLSPTSRYPPTPLHTI